MMREVVRCLISWPCCRRVTFFGFHSSLYFPLKQLFAFQCTIGLLGVNLRVKTSDIYNCILRKTLFIPYKNTGIYFSRLRHTCISVFFQDLHEEFASFNSVKSKCLFFVQHYCSFWTTRGIRLHTTDRHSRHLAPAKNSVGSISSQQLLSQRLGLLQAGRGSTENKK